MVADASNTLNSLATSRSVTSRGLAENLVTAEAEEANAKAAFDETKEIHEEAKEVNPDVDALAELKV